MKLKARKFPVYDRSQGNPFDWILVKAQEVRERNWEINATLRAAVHRPFKDELKLLKELWYENRIPSSSNDSGGMHKRPDDAELPD